MKVIDQWIYWDDGQYKHLYACTDEFMVLHFFVQWVDYESGWPSPISRTEWLSPAQVDYIFRKIIGKKY